MSVSVGVDEVEVAEAKAALRARGWYVRYTEWPSGHQVVLHLRADTSVHIVTEWRATEVEAFREALRLADGAAALPRAGPHPSS